MKIRKAESKDCKNVYQLSNDSVVRKNSFNTDKITFDDHVKWFNEKLVDKNCVFYVVENSRNDFVGYVRFGKQGPSLDTFTITVHIHNEYRNKGLGTEIIKMSSLKILNVQREVNIIAYVKKDNIASFKSFKKAGYIKLSDIMVNNVDCYKLGFNYEQCNSSI